MSAFWEAVIDCMIIIRSIPHINNNYEDMPVMNSANVHSVICCEQWQ